MAKQKNKAKKSKGEMSAVQDVFGALESLNPTQRAKVLASVQALLDIPGAGLLENAAEDVEARQSDGQSTKPKSTNGRKSTSRKSTSRKSTNGRKSTNRKSTNRKSTARSGSKKSTRRRKATTRS
ncbi:MAG: hypothetical protein H0V77_03565 [Actinobacteria bacterium]|nr:hypothetical protein [Actinomycetota bacterium]